MNNCMSIKISCEFRYFLPLKNNFRFALKYSKEKCLTLRGIWMICCVLCEEIRSKRYTYAKIAAQTSIYSFHDGNFFFNWCFCYIDIQNVLMKMKVAICKAIKKNNKFYWLIIYINVNWMIHSMCDDFTFITETTCNNKKK